MVNTRFKAVIGSWKIIAISFPRISVICLHVNESNSSPFKIIVPFTISPGCLISLMIDKAVILLPLPDSPTNATVSPGSIEKNNHRPL